MINILIDYREHKSGIYHIFKQMKDVEVKYSDLELGDYLVEDQLLFERKTLIDFVSAIKDGRLFRQACRLITAKAKPILILEGKVNDLQESNIKRAAIQGAIINLTLMLGIPMLRSKSPEESTRLMVYAAKQLNYIVREPVLRKGKRPKGKKARQLQLLQALPGVGPKRAMALLERFGSIDSLVAANMDELSTLYGIGKHTAEEIYSILHEPVSTYGKVDLWEEI